MKDGEDQIMEDATAGKDAPVEVDPTAICSRTHPPPP